MLAVAQVVRVPDCESGGCGFKSRRSPHNIGVDYVDYVRESFYQRDADLHA